MALDATRMVNKGHLIHTDVKQFIDLLTGVMTDQPVHIANDVTAASLTVGGTLAVYGGPSTFMFGASMSSGAWTGNGSVPPGGASGQVLSKSAATDYAVAWTTPATGVTWPLLAPDGSAAAPSYAFASNSGTGIYSNGVALGITTGGTFRAFFGGSISFNAPLQFSTDNTYDIGAPSSARPRSIYAMTSVSGGSGTTLTTIGQSAASGAYLVGSNFGGVILGSASTAYFSMSASNFAPFTDNTKDLGTSSQRMKDGYFAGTLTVTTAFVGPGAVPTGGTTGQALTKNTATNYDLVWATVMTQAAGDARYLPLTGGTLTGPGNLTVVGTTQHTGNVGIGTAPVTYSGLMFQPTMAGANQFALYAPLTFSTTGTGNTFVFYTLPTYAASTRTVAAGASFYADTPTLGAGVTVTGMYGLFVGNQGRSGVTKAYGIYVNPISGATNNFAIQTNGPVNVFGGRTNFGGTDQGDQHYFILFATTPPPTSGFGGMTFSDQTGLRIEYWSNSLGNGSVTGLFAAVLGGNTSKTAVANGIQIGNPGNQGAGIGTSTGLRIDNVVSGSDNNYEMWLGVPSGAAGDNKSIVFGNSGEYIRNPKNAANNLSIESSDGNLMLSGKASIAMGGNAYWDGTNWQRYDTAAGSMIWSLGAATATCYTSASGGNPITVLTPVLTVNPSGLVDVLSFRATAGPAATVGAGIEIYSGGTYGVVQSYNRTTATYLSTVIVGSAVTLQPMGVGFVAIALNGAAPPNAAGAMLAFNNVTGAKINLYDVGGGSMFGFGVNSGELTIVTSANLTVRNASMSSAIILTLSNSGNLQVPGILQSLNGNVYLIGSNTAVTSDGTNLMLYANTGGVFTRATAIYAQNTAGTYVNMNAAAFVVQSAARDKIAVRTLDDPLSIVLDDRLHGISYMDRVTTDRRIGFVADEWQAVVPEIVSLNPDGMPMGMDYARVGAVTFEALKQFANQTNSRLDALEAKLAA